MKKIPVKQQLAMDYLRQHPELHMTGAKRLAVEVSNPRLSRMTWHRAKDALGIAKLPTGGQGSYGNTYYERKTLKTPISEETIKIEVDRSLRVIRFHRRNGEPVERTKPNRDYLNASLALFEHRGWVVTDERFGVMTLKPT